MCSCGYLIITYKSIHWSLTLFKQNMSPPVHDFDDDWSESNSASTNNCGYHSW